MGSETTAILDASRLKISEIIQSPPHNGVYNEEEWQITSGDSAIWPGAAVMTRITDNIGDGEGAGGSGS